MSILQVHSCRKSKGWLKISVSVVCFGLLVWMIWKSDPEVLWNHMLLMGWQTLVLCVGLWFVIYVLNALSWGMIVWSVSGVRIPYIDILRYTISGYALNYITPLGMLGGEPYRIWALKKQTDLGHATSSVMLYAMMHFCSHFLFWIIGCLVALSMFVCSSVWKCSLLLAVVALCVFLLFVFFQGFKLGFVEALFASLSRMPLLGPKVASWFEKNRVLIASIDQSIRSLPNLYKGKLLLSLFLELAARLVGCLEFCFLGLAIGFSIDYVEALCISAFSSLFANVLFFSPLQMGTREGGIVWSLWLIGYGADFDNLLPLAVAVSLGTRIREFVWIALGLILIIINEYMGDSPRNNNESSNT
ncbi:MAG: lysylphosphatidylglycerol synthase transmembrane domain-containing protein [Bacteroidales bacterium]|nr:lysylphosphatidylglycerol synthase transmembrane domain-containing protein [Bacteroidales bacterium]